MLPTSPRNSHADIAQRILIMYDLHNFYTCSHFSTPAHTLHTCTLNTFAYIFYEFSQTILHKYTVLHTCPLNTFAHTSSHLNHFCTLPYTFLHTSHFFHTCTLLTLAHYFAHFHTFFLHTSYYFAHLHTLGHYINLKIFCAQIRNITPKMFVN